MGWALYDKKARTLDVFPGKDAMDIHFEDIECIEGWDEEAEQAFLDAVEEERDVPCSFLQQARAVLDDQKERDHGS